MWRNMLKQESEHQWIAITGFFVFIIVGAIFIKGTSHIPGVDLVDNELGADYRVMDAKYIDESNSFMLTYTNDGYEYIILNSGELNVIIDSTSETDVDSISGITLVDNDSVLIANGENNAYLIKDSTLYNFEINFGLDDFSLSQIEQSENHPDRYLMITQEIDNLQGIRGLNTTGITSSSTPNNENVRWDKISHVSNGKWIATGIYNTPVTTGDQSPAAPGMKPVWATILWDGGHTAPMIDNINLGVFGEYHSTIELNHDNVIIAGTHETVLFNHITGTTHDIDYSSVAGLSDKCDSAWLFNGKDSTSVLRFVGTSWDVEELPHKIPLQIEASGFDGSTIYLHGIDDNGNSKTLTFDTTAVGSIESGSGFINLTFIIVSLIMFSIMAVNILDKFRK
tara:strand:- start:4391 stop:5578 length:1188 start_codon:yes stop_codon:yes gene_type:complete